MEVSHGDTGTYGLQVVEYKCHGFYLFIYLFLRRETMGLNVLNRFILCRF